MCQLGSLQLLVGATHYDDLTGKNVEQLMRKLLERADGAQVVLESMSMRLMKMEEGKMNLWQGTWTSEPGGRRSVVAGVEIIFLMT